MANKPCLQVACALMHDATGNTTFRSVYNYIAHNSFKEFPQQHDHVNACLDVIAAFLDSQDDEVTLGEIFNYED